MKPIGEIADIIELRTWGSGHPATVSGLIDQLQSSLDEEDKQRAEEIAQNVMDEMQNRQKLLGKAYPFTTDGAKLEVSHQKPANTTYLFCLGLSLLPAPKISNEQRCIQFETVVMHAANSFFGGDAIRIGAPWRSEEIPEYTVLLDRVIDLIPNLGKKLKTAAPDGGDAGWDVLIVKNFKDNLFPRFIALGNCATGRTDWMRKGMETQTTLFWDYFQSNPRSVLVTFFAVPFVMDENARLRKLNPTNLTLDRFRICEHAPLTPMAEIAAWIEEQREHATDIPLN